MSGDNAAKGISSMWQKNVSTTKAVIKDMSMDYAYRGLQQASKIKKEICGDDDKKGK
ncbi:MAG: hypothetical protein WCV91_00830 [Candidatus Margulisiibacteriota bacterium]